MRNVEDMIVLLKVGFFIIVGLIAICGGIFAYIAYKQEKEDEVKLKREMGIIDEFETEVNDPIEYFEDENVNL